MTSDKSAQAKRQKRGQPENRGRFVKQERPKAETAETPSINLDAPQPTSPIHGSDWAKNQIGSIARQAGSCFGSRTIYFPISEAVTAAADASEGMSNGEAYAPLFEEFASEHARSRLVDNYEGPGGPEVGRPHGWLGGEVLESALNDWLEFFDALCRRRNCEPGPCQISKDRGGIEFSVAATTVNGEVISPLHVLHERGDLMDRKAGEISLHSPTGELLHVQFGESDMGNEMPSVVAKASFDGFLPIGKMQMILDNRFDDAFDGIESEISSRYT